MTKSQLSSDILEQQFGPTAIEVLEQDDQTRLICTRVIATGQVLEISYVTFVQAGIEEFPDIHRAVVGGQSMGKAFRTHNIEFTRQMESSQKRSAPVNFSHYFDNDRLATIINVAILVGPRQTPYAQITETYSSVVDWPTAKS